MVLFYYTTGPGMELDRQLKVGKHLKYLTLSTVVLLRKARYLSNPR